MRHHRQPHQEEAIYDVVDGFKHYDRGQYISACGTGKTLTCMWVKEDLDMLRTLVMVPSLALLGQYAGEWRKHHSPDHRYATLCVCSDNTVGQIDDDDDELHVTTDDLEHDGFEVTSDSDRIARFLEQDVRQVIFCTYHSSHLIEAAQRNNSIPSFGLAIADEAHRCAGDPDSLFAIILDENRIRAEKRLFATATPRIYKLRKGQDISETNFVDMSSEKHFGPRFHTLTFGEAIRRGLLSDYQVVIMMVDETDVRPGLTKNESALWAAQVGLIKAIQQFGLRKVITFHNYVKNAAEFAHTLSDVAAAMPNHNQYPVLPVADFVSGKMTAQVRRKKLKMLGAGKDGECHILSNARCLTEGTDVPDLDGMAYIDPRSNTIDIAQGLGRVIRKHASKTHGTIVLPVFVSKHEDVSRAINRSNFQPIWDVLSALRAHDADFEAALNKRRQEEGGSESSGSESSDTDPFAKIKIVGTDRVVELSRAIRPMIVQELTDDWEVGFGAAKAYFEAHGHCNVPVRTIWPENDSNGFGLGGWIVRQRKVFNQGKLSSERKEKLESLGMVWGVRDEQWDLCFACAKAYFKKHGHCNIPNRATWPENEPNGLSLGNWITRQRTAFSKGKLSDERKEKLEGIGLVWDVRDEQWEQGYACAKAYFEKYGHCNVSVKTTWPEDDINGFGLGLWINHKRNASNKEKLPDERKEKLEAINISWKQSLPRFTVETPQSPDDRWEQAFGFAKAYVAKYGHCNILQTTTWPEDDPNGFRLGVWLTTQRKAYFGKCSKRQTSIDYISRLESIGMIWDPLEKQWESGFIHAQSYHAIHGHCNAPLNAMWPEGDSSGFKLGQWLITQRKAYKRGAAPADHVKKLESIGMTWVVNKESAPVVRTNDELEDSMSDESIGMVL